MNAPDEYNGIGGLVDFASASPLGQRMLIWQALCDDVSSLAELLALWRQLYGNGTYVALMNKTALFAFGWFQFTLWQSILLGIQRLLDPHTVGHKHETLTIATLLEWTAKQHGALPGTQEQRAQLGAELARLRTDCSVIGTVRHEYLAHRAFKTLTQNGPSVPSRTVLAALEGIAALLDFFGREFLDGSRFTLHEGVPPDADRLMTLLRIGFEQENR